MNANIIKTQKGFKVKKTLTIKEKLSQMTFCQAHAQEQDKIELQNEALEAVKKVMHEKDWEGITQEKIGKATQLVKDTYPTLNTIFIVTEGINRYLKD